MRFVSIEIPTDVSTGLSLEGMSFFRKSKRHSARAPARFKAHTLTWVFDLCAAVRGYLPSSFTITTTCLMSSINQTEKYVVYFFYWFLKPPYHLWIPEKNRDIARSCPTGMVGLTHFIMRGGPMELEGFKKIGQRLLKNLEPNRLLVTAT